MKNLMKKSLIALMLVVCFAAFSGFDYSKDRVIDEYDEFTEEQKDELQEKCNEVSEKLHMDMVIVINPTVQYSEMQAYADDYFDYNGYGYEDNRTSDRSGVLLLLSDEHMYVSTSGMGIAYIDDDDVERILDAVEESFWSDKFDSCNNFLDKTESIVLRNKRADNGRLEKKWNNYSGSYKSFYNKYMKKGVLDFTRNPLIDAAIALVVAAITVLIMASANKSKMTTNGNTYMDRNQFNVHRKSDMYIRTTSVRHEKSSSSGGGGGGGSFHSGSSGSSHGGGGR